MNEPIQKRSSIGDSLKRNYKTLKLYNASQKNSSYQTINYKNYKQVLVTSPSMNKNSSSKMSNYNAEDEMMRNLK